MMTWLAWFPDTAWKGTILLAAAWLATRLLQKQPAALRHLVWTVTLGGLLAMPVLSATVPVQLSLPARAVSAPLSPSTSLNKPAAVTQSDINDRSRPADNSQGAVAAAQSPSPSNSMLPELSAAQGMMVAWLLGVAVLAIRFLSGVVMTARLHRTASQADERVHNALEQAASRAGLRAAPRLIVTDAVAIPCAFGWLRPTIVLPADARTWTRDRLDLVLLHESTHIRRGDYVMHLVAEAARILHWYNPLVWVASRALRAEAERATDERVINAGATASDYAGHLLDIVRGAGAQRVPAPLLPLAMRSEFEGRVIAILEHVSSRRLRARTAAITLAVGTGLAATVASIGAAAPAASSVVGSPEISAIPRDVEPSKPYKQQSAQSASETASTTQALLSALSDSVPAVRLAVVNALHDSRDTLVVRALMRVLREDDNAEVRRAAAHSLGEIADTLALSALTDALLRDRDVEVRRNAAEAIGSLESERGATALSQALDADEDLQVRIHAAEALGHIKGSTAADALSRAIGRASDPKLKVAVIEALDNLDETRALPAITAALRDPNASVRSAAAHALDGVEDKSIIPPLIAAARDDDVEVRRAVIDALNDFDDRRLVDVFANALTDRDPEVRSAAASGLGNIEDLQTAPRQLIAALDDANEEVRHEVAHALGHIQDPASLNALLAKVGDPSKDVRLAVIESISEFKDASVTTALQRALRDGNAEVREAAARALGDRKRK